MDATTRWETEAIRAGQRPQVSQKRPEAGQPDARQWVTLREAATAIDVPVGTVRSWAKTDEVPSYLQLENGDALRMVDLEAVRTRARTLGRTVDDETSEQASRDAPVALEERAYEGNLLVPIDAWNKMLTQLGNLHEAGQQLAEARERAARAETEVVFLRERLKELREETTSPGPSPESTAPSSQPTAPSPQPRSSFFSYIYRGWRSRRTARP